VESPSSVPCHAVDASGRLSHFPARIPMPNGDRIITKSNPGSHRRRAPTRPVDRLPSSPYRSTPCCAPQRPRGCGIVGSSAGSESGRSHGERRRDRERAARIWIVDTEDLVIQYEVAVEVGALTGNFAAAGDMGEGLRRRGAGRRAGQDAGRVKRGLHLLRRLQASPLHRPGGPRCVSSSPTRSARPPTSSACPPIARRAVTRSTSSRCASSPSAGWR